MGNQLNDSSLLANGYERFGRTAFDSENIVCNFKKSFFDDDGRGKYFIVVHKWDVGFILKNSTDEIRCQYGYEYSSQLIRKGSNKVMDMSFRSDWELWEVEDFVESMFATGEFGFYEEVC